MPNALTLSSLPLFPLGAVLFPGGILPLRIFEVRYLDMIGKCHKAGAPFGIVSLTQGHEVRGAESAINPETFCVVGTLARILDFDNSQPGLMTIRASGSHRFRISTSNQLKHGLWVADVAQLDDDMSVPIPEDLQHTSDALSALIESLTQRDIPPAQMPLQGPWQLQDCGWVANRWCELLPVPSPIKQRLMELDNPLVRLELVSDLLERTGITG